MAEKNTYEMKEFYDEIIALLEKYISDNDISEEELKDIIEEYKSIRKKYSDEFIGLFTKNYGLLLPDLEAKVRIEDLNINTTVIDTLIADLFNKLEGKINETGGEFTGDVKAIDYKPIYETNNGIYPEHIKSDSTSELATLKTMQNYLEHLLRVDEIVENVIMSYNINEYFEDARDNGLYDDGIEYDNKYELTDAGTLYIKYDGKNKKAIIS